MRAPVYDGRILRVEDRCPCDTKYALAALLAALLAACGTSTTGTARSTATTTASATATTAAHVCQAAQLAASVTDRGAASGHSRTDVSLRNTAAQTCSLDGYPALQLLDASGGAVPTHVTGVTLAYVFSNLSPAVVTLAPGGSAYFVLQWSEVDGTGACANPEASASLHITPPDTSAAVTAAVALHPCDGNLISSPIVAAA
jgi:hypothetical protein